MTTTEHEYSSLHHAASVLAAVCDGAVTQDGVGYNGHDTKFGRRVAQMGTNEWTSDIACEVYEMLRTYQNQLLGYGVIYKDLKKPEGVEYHDSQLARQQAREAEYRRKNAPYIKFDANGEICVYNSFPIKDELKSNGFSYRDRMWHAPLNADSAGTVLGIPSIVLSDEYHDKLLQMADSGPKSDTSVKTAEKPANIRVCTNHPNKMKKEFPPDHLILDTPFSLIPLPITQGLPGREWDRDNKVNHILPNISLYDLAEEFNLTISDDARKLIETKRAEQEAERNAKKAIIAESLATDTDMTVALDDYMRNYQKAGTAYMVNHGNALNADEMGLGKTCQSLAAVETANAYPCLIVAPASLILNWEREIENLLPNRRIQVLNGRAGGWDIPERDFCIVSYDVLASYLPYLYRLRGLICDEAHYAKNTKSGRTKAVMTIAGCGVEERRDENTGKKYHVPLPGLMQEEHNIFMLTGTPVLNRPVELVPLLLCLGALTREKGDPHSVTWFLYRFCAKRDKSTGRLIEGYGGHHDFNGANNLEELHMFLRQTCMVQRSKTDVLKELPPKIRTPQFVALDKADMALYDQLADEGAERAANSRAEALVYMNALRSAVGTALIPHATEWAIDFMETGKSLVIFADHIDVQKALVRNIRDAGFSVVEIRGGQKKSDREEAKRAFQAKEARVIVCSLKAGGVGHTLTAASDVLIVEVPWNPGTEDQAVDRVHRIGQVDSVTSYHLVPQGTFAQDLWEIVQRKRAITNMVNKGVSVAADEESAFTAVLDRTLAKHGQKRHFASVKDEEVDDTPKEEKVTECAVCGEINLCTQVGEIQPGFPEGEWMCLTCI